MQEHKVNDVTYASPQQAGTSIIQREQALTSPAERLLSDIERRGHADYRSLSDAERVWFTVSRLLFCIRDGGLISYSNGYAVRLADCTRQTLETHGMLQLVRRMNARFGDRVPTSAEAINDAIATWGPESAAEDDSDEKLEQARYVDDALAEYVRKQGWRG